MREIPVSGGDVALVDDDLFDHLSKFSWSASRRPTVTYAVTWPTSERCIRMHQMVMELSGVRVDVMIDHRNGNGLDNRRENIRPATGSQNMMNREHRKGRSGYRGVWQTKEGRWAAFICVNRKRTYLGRFDTAEKAAEAYDIAAKQLHGEFARLNAEK